jgi:nitrite reductase (NO-forming)
MSNKRADIFSNKRGIKKTISLVIISAVLVTGIITTGFVFVAATRSDVNNSNMAKAILRTTTAAIDSNNINNNNILAPLAPTKDSGKKEFTMIAEEATMEMSPGERVNVWTFNGTVPGPTLRFTEGDNVTIHFINKASMAHTLHLHGTHDSKNDGAFPLILPNQSYNYNFIAEPAGAFLYHCHAPPTSLHIRMGMYGSLIIDPKNSTVLKPAREFAIVLSEFDPTNQDSFIPKYYPMNGYTDQYMDNNSLTVRQNELVRLYVSNIGTTIPYSFHLHSTIFKVYPSGIISNKPIDVQTISIAPGDAALVEAVWKYPGTYLMHSHGLQEERGNMAQIHVIPAAEENNSGGAAANSSSSSSTKPVTDKSISMIDWQYGLQKKLQKPIISAGNKEEVDHTTTTTKAEAISNIPTSSMAEEQEQQQHAAANVTSHHDNSAAATVSTTQIKILKGSWDNKQKDNYSPKQITTKVGSTITWTNEDNLPHTITSDKTGLFDSSIVSANQQWKHTFDKIGIYEYHCTLHPWMEGNIIVR